MTDYLDRAELSADLEAIGFHTVGYGCTVYHNSGPLIPEVADTIREHDLKAAAVLSGNRNFEGRVNPLVQPSYLASPPLVVAYALAGTVDIDLATDPIGQTVDEDDVFLRDIWPSNHEIQKLMERCVTRNSSSADTQMPTAVLKCGRLSPLRRVKFMVGTRVNLRTGAALLCGIVTGDSTHRLHRWCSCAGQS